MTDSGVEQSQLGEQDILMNLSARTKKQALEALCSHAARRVGYSPHKLLNTVLEREQLGSTAHEGTAIPHCQLETLSEHRFIFAKLSNPIEFEADDEQPVDMILLFLAPLTSGKACQYEYARIMRKLGERANLLRSAKQPKDILMAFEDS